MLNFIFAQKSFSQTTKPISERTTRILFLLDASASMAIRMDSKWEDGTRMDAAKKILAQIVDTLKRKPNLEIGLRAFGSQSPTPLNDCSDSKLLVPFGTANIPYIKDALKTIKPTGITPIALSFEKAMNDFPKDSTARNIVILITDGEESCGGDPCAISLAMQKNHIFLRPFIIAINAETNLSAEYECMGNYFNAQNPEGLKTILTNIVMTSLNPTSVQINLLDINGKATETDVDISFTDYYTKQTLYNYYHTITYSGVSDTISLDPVLKYDLTVHTIPAITKLNVDLKPNVVNVINIPAPQGFLYVKTQTVAINNNVNNKIKCIVMKAGTSEEVNLQGMGLSEKYLCGKYDLEFLTLPRTTISNVDISERETTTIQIPTPGVLSVSKSFPVVGGIFTCENNEWKKIYDFAETTGNETVALQPGTYKVIYKSKSSKKTADSQTKTITISTGENSSIAL